MELHLPASQFKLTTQPLDESSLGRAASDAGTKVDLSFHISQCALAIKFGDIGWLCEYVVQDESPSQTC